MLEEGSVIRGTYLKYKKNCTKVWRRQWQPTPVTLA